MRWAVQFLLAALSLGASATVPDCRISLGDLNAVATAVVSWKDVETAALVSNEALLESLAREKPVCDLLNGRNTTDESLREHTLAVMNRFDEQLALRPGLKAALEPYRPEMRLALALHDIGKPMALAADGNSWRQKEFTTVVLDAYLSKWGVPPEKARLIRSMVLADMTDNAYGFRKSLNTASVGSFWANEAKDMPSYPPSHLAALRMLFFLSDASFYPNVMAASFERAGNGQLTIRLGDPLSASRSLVDATGGGIDFSSFYSTTPVDEYLSPEVVRERWNVRHENHPGASLAWAAGIEENRDPQRLRRRFTDNRLGETIGIDTFANTNALATVREKLSKLSADERRNAVVVFTGVLTQYEAAHRYATGQGAATVQVLPVDAFNFDANPKILRSDFYYVEKSGSAEKLGDAFKALSQ